MYGNSVITVSKKHNIPSLSIEPGIVNKKLEYPDLYKADKICIYGIQGFETLKSLGYDEKRIALTGNPRYDRLKNMDSNKSKEILSKTHNIDSNKKLIIIAMGRWHEGDEIWMSNLIKFCNHNNFEIVIKIHPLYKIKWQKENTNKINAISKICQDLKYLMTYDFDSSTLLSAADLVVTDYSNVGVEAILLNKLLITVNFAGENLENVQRYHDHNVSIHMDEYNKIEELIMKIFSGEQLITILQKDRDRLIPQYNFHNDGKATLRVVNLLLQREN